MRQEQRLISRFIPIASILLLLVSCSAKAESTKSPEEPVKPETITIAFGGDTNGIEHISNFLNQGGDPFAGVSDQLKAADIAVINLESAITNRTTHQEKQYVFNSNPYLLDWAKTSGVDVINIANNHAGDYFREGAIDTINAIEERGMKVIGGGKNGREAWTSDIVTVRGTKIALLGIAKVNGGVNTIASGEMSGTTDGWNPQVIELAIRAAARQAKIVIVYAHWGVEEQFCPEPSDVADAQKWLEWGASAVIGSHPHRQQPAVRYGTKLVDYSLGNFVYYVRGGAGLESGIGLMTLSTEGEVLNYKFLPALINPNTGAPVLLSGKQKQEAIAKKQRSCKSLGN